MNNEKFLISNLAGIFLLAFLSSFNGVKKDKTIDFYVGWAHVDITPDEPVHIRSPYTCHVSEGVMDPVTVTALAMESGSGPSSKKTIMISADYWHYVRVELRKRLGRDIFILPQCSAAGDQRPEDFFKFDFKAEERMQQLMFPGVETGGRGSIGRMKQIATRISDAVTSVLPYMKDNIEWAPIFAHKMEVIELSRRLISNEDANTAIQESEHHRKSYEQLLLEITENPEIKEGPRWYNDITGAYVRMNRAQSFKDRYELQKIQPKLPVEVHVVRVGDIVMATNPCMTICDHRHARLMN